MHGVNSEPERLKPVRAQDRRRLNGAKYSHRPASAAVRAQFDAAHRPCPSLPSRDREGVLPQGTNPELLQNRARNDAVCGSRIDDAIQRGPFGGLYGIHDHHFHAGGDHCR